MLVVLNLNIKCVRRYARAVHVNVAGTCLAEHRSPCRAGQRLRAVPEIIAEENRGSSHVYHAEITCICASFPPRIHAFGKPPTTLLQRSAVLRQLHFACSPCLSCLSDVSYQDAYAGMRFMGFTGREVFFSMLQPMFAPTAHAQVWRVFGHGHENLLI